MSTPAIKPEYRLHCMAQSGNSYKCALALELAGADWTPVWVDFFNGGTRTAAFRSKNTMAEVPVLEHAGLTLTQSGVILDYLTGTLGRFGPRDEEERREILRWTLWDNHKLTSYTATLRWMLNFMPEDKRDPAVIAWLRGRMLSAFKTLDTHLTGRTWVVGDRMTTADLSLTGYLFFEKEYGIDWSDYPAIGAWTARIAAEPGWKHPYDLMPGHPLPKPA